MGFVHWSKVESFFHVFIFGKISQQNVFDDNYSRKKKKEFLDFKIRKLKKSKNRDFSKGVIISPWLWKKFEIFPCFYFWQDQPAKCV